MKQEQANNYVCSSQLEKLQIVKNNILKNPVQVDLLNLPYNNPDVFNELSQKIINSITFV